MRFVLGFVIALALVVAACSPGPGHVDRGQSDHNNASAE